MIRRSLPYVLDSPWPAWPLLCLLLLFACGSDSNDAPSSAQSDSSAAAESTEFETGDDLTKPPPSDRSFDALFEANTDYEYFENAGKFPFQPDADQFELTNAWWAAEMAQLSYVDDEDFILEKLEPAGLPEFKFFRSEEGKDHDTQCFVARNEEFLFVVFRGTEPGEIQDFITDANVLLAKADSGGSVHKGFRDALDAIWPELKVYLESVRAAGQPVFFTGHSLGATLATIAASRVEDASAVFTFGSPRPGNLKFRDSLAVPVYRFVNGTDMITKTPPPGLYAHVGDIFYFDSENRLREDTDALDRIGEGLSARFDHIKEKIAEWKDGETGNVPLRDLEDHAPIYYTIKIWNELVRGYESPTEDPAEK